MGDDGNDVLMACAVPSGKILIPRFASAAWWEGRLIENEEPLYQRKKSNQTTLPISAFSHLLSLTRSNVFIWFSSFKTYVNPFLILFFAVSFSHWFFIPVHISKGASRLDFIYWHLALMGKDRAMKRFLVMLRKNCKMWEQKQMINWLQICKFEC